MAFYPTDKILRDVRVVIDQDKVSNQLQRMGDIETLSLNDIIQSKILDGVAFVHREAPVHYLDGGVHFGDTVHWEEMESGWTLLPANFMRLMVFMMSDWERPVFSAIDTQDKAYALQRSRFKGLRGTPQKPICAIVNRPEGKTLEFFSCKSDKAFVRKAIYLPYPVFEDDGVVITERCYPASVYAIASFVCETLDDTERSISFSEISKSALL